MGVKVLPEIDSYWSSSPLIGCSWIKSTMPRNRFKTINRFLHLADNAFLRRRGDPNYDPIFKVRPIVEHMKTRFRQYFVPHKCLAIDEAMIKFNGRLKFKQYMPSKPTKFGIKVWEICDSSNGYCLDFDVYTGKESDPPSRNGVGYDVIEKLTRPYTNKFHHVYFDRYFTGLPIVEHLLRLNTYASGTVNLNRKGLPKRAKSLKLKRGAARFFQKENSRVVLTTWRDKRQVSVLSSNCTDALGENGKPKSIIDYNNHMGGVDLSDQMCAYYRIGRPAHKWWRYVFWFCLNLAITNSWLLFKSTVTREELKKAPTHLKYRLLLAEQLRNYYSASKIVRGRPTKCLPSTAHVFDRIGAHKLVKFDGRSKKCRQCSVQGRRTARGYKKETQYKCKLCDIPLCKVHCFASFHNAA